MTGVAAKAIGWTGSGLVPDSRRNAVTPILAETYGEAEAGRWWMRWRMFFMACEELFRFNNGNEWFVSHYSFKKGCN